MAETVHSDARQFTIDVIALFVELMHERERGHDAAADTALAELTRMGVVVRFVSLAPTGRARP